jgi:hypothetical protein
MRKMYVTVWQSTLTAPAHDSHRSGRTGSYGRMGGFWAGLLFAKRNWFVDMCARYLPFLMQVLQQDTWRPVLPLLLSCSPIRCSSSLRVTPSMVMLWSSLYIMPSWWACRSTERVSSMITPPPPSVEAILGANGSRSRVVPPTCVSPLRPRSNIETATKVARLMNSLGKYIYTVGSDDTIHVHLFISSFTDLVIGGANVRVRQEASSPWATGASATLVVESEGSQVLRFSMRKPLGAEQFQVGPLSTDILRTTTFLQVTTLGLLATCTTNGDFINVCLNSGRSSRMYAFTIGWTYRPRRLHPHPLTLENRGCVAFARGPFIYCAESTDNESIDDFRGLRVADDAGLEEIEGEHAFKGSGLEPVLLKTRACMVEGDDVAASKEVPLTLVPLFMWANRGLSNLRVWLPRK